MIKMKDAVKASGVSQSTIMRWERDGVIDPIKRDVIGTRIFSEADVKMLGEVRDWYAKERVKQPHERKPYPKQKRK